MKNFIYAVLCSLFTLIGIMLGRYVSMNELIMIGGLYVFAVGISAASLGWRL